jgi:hypothetical protein
MHIVRTRTSQARHVSAQDVADLELAGTWVVDVRRTPRSLARTGWLVEGEDDIAFLSDDPRATAEEASALVWPLSTWPLDAA